MAEIPIYLEPESVRKILDGTKRSFCFPAFPARAGSVQATSPEGYWRWLEGTLDWRDAPFRAGDFIFIQEDWADADPNRHGKFLYRADCLEDPVQPEWQSGHFMDLDAQRLVLKVTGIRGTRLRDVDWMEAQKLGFPNGDPCRQMADWWDGIWERIPGLHWRANPAVWLLEFCVLRGGET